MRTLMTRGKKRRPRWAILTTIWPGGRTEVRRFRNASRGSDRDHLIQELAIARRAGAHASVEEVDTATMRRLMALKERIER